MWTEQPNSLQITWVALVSKCLLPDIYCINQYRWITDTFSVYCMFPPLYSTDDSRAEPDSSHTYTPSSEYCSTSTVSHLSRSTSGYESEKQWVFKSSRATLICRAVAPSSFCTTMWCSLMADLHATHHSVNFCVHQQLSICCCCFPFVSRDFPLCSVLDYLMPVRTDSNLRNNNSNYAAKHPDKCAKCSIICTVKIFLPKISQATLFLLVWQVISRVNQLKRQSHIELEQIKSVMLRLIY